MKRFLSSVILLFLFFQVFSQTTQSLSYEEHSSYIDKGKIEMGYIELNPKLPKSIGDAVLACRYLYTTITPIDKTLQYVQENPELSKKQNMESKYQTILLANSTNSIFRDENLYIKDSILYFSADKLSLDSLIRLDRKYRLNGVRNLLVTEVVKNHPNHKMSVLDEAAPNSYHYEESQEELNWTLMDDTLTVCGYVCYKAKADYGGRTWMAWFTPEIPITDGPWKLYGLPGLILKATDVSGIHSFEAKSIQNSNYPIYLKPHPSSFSVKRNEFIIIKKRLESAVKPENTVPFIGIRMFGVIGENLATLEERRVLINRICIYEPLELE